MSFKNMKNRTESGQKKSISRGKDDVRYWRDRVRQRSFRYKNRTEVSKEWQLRLQFEGQDNWFPLGTDNRDVAARKARDIYRIANAQGIEAAVQRFKPKSGPKKQGITLGEYFESVKKNTDINPSTIAVYQRKMRRIVIDLIDVPAGLDKYNYQGGGAYEWRKHIDATPLASITPDRINQWKRSYMDNIGSDPVARRRAEHTVNSTIRSAKALFAPRVVARLKDIELPEILPFEGVEFFRQSAARYRSEIDASAIIAKAQKDLGESAREQYKIFLLAIFVGLRRKEIDCLLWSAFDWERSLLRIRPTTYHGLKTESSIGDVPLEPQIADIFMAHFKEATGEFVIDSDCEPKMETQYEFYRANHEFTQLIKWLRQNGVTAQKPLHTLRKEYGRLITEQHGIFAASKLLRHSSIHVTASHYADDTRHLTTGLGNLLIKNEKRATAH